LTSPLHRTLVISVLGSVAVAVSAAQTPDQDDSRRLHGIDRPFAFNGQVRQVQMDFSAGEYRVIGAADERLRVEWSVRREPDASRVDVEARVQGNRAMVMTDGFNNDGLRVAVHVPQRSDLRIRLSAGELRVEGVDGSKNVQSYAGEVDIDVGRAEDYRRVDASIWAGELRAAPFRVEKSGLFRSFDWRGTGPYTLHARLGAGELTLFSRPQPSAGR
jgi:hypothetical protein